jgi:hypothetical protein
MVFAACGGLALAVTVGPPSNAAPAIAPVDSKTSAVTPRADEPAAKIDAIIARLGHESFAIRAAAQRELMALGIDAVPKLRKAYEATADVEIRWRLKRAIHTITRPQWYLHLKTAQQEAARSGKLLMVFSTIGQAEGFS